MHQMFHPDSPSLKSPVMSPTCPFIVNHQNHRMIMKSNVSVRSVLYVPSIKSSVSNEDVAVAVKSPELSMISVEPILRPFLILKFKSPLKFPPSVSLVSLYKFCVITPLFMIVLCLKKKRGNDSPFF